MTQSSDDEGEKILGRNDQERFSESSEASSLPTSIAEQLDDILNYSDTDIVSEQGDESNNEIQVMRTPIKHIPEDDSTPQQSYVFTPMKTRLHSKKKKQETIETDSQKEETTEKEKRTRKLKIFRPRGENFK